MKNIEMLIILVFLMALTALPALADTVEDNCWGQATAAFAATGQMGEHASEVTEPGQGRQGLRNLARELYEAGLIPDDSMASLGAFVVAADPELNDIEACE
jgi:hypothetical protein